MSIDKFVTRAKHSWISEKRIYIKPKNGGVGAINLKVYASSLRMAWVKRTKGGLWSDTMTFKVENPENICYLESSDIHKMHLGKRHVAESFPEVHKAFKTQKADNVKMHTPLNHIGIIRINGPRIRNNGTRMGKPTQNNAPYLFNSKGRCELKLKDLGTEILYLGNAAMDNRLIYLKVRKLSKEGTDNLTLDHKHGQKGLTDVLRSVKKGSTKYK